MVSWLTGICDWEGECGKAGSKEATREARSPPRGRPPCTRPVVKLCSDGFHPREEGACVRRLREIGGGHKEKQMFL